MVLCTERSLVKHDRQLLVVKPLRCRCWGCEHCVHQRQKELWWKAFKGDPRIFLTLTMKPQPGMTPDDQAEAFVTGFRMLRQFLCRHLKRKSITFLAVFEAHESGWPHLHILLRGGFIDHRLIRRWWNARFGSYQIDIRLAKNTRQRASYVSKYVAKAPKGFGHCKRYWCSKDWDPPAKEKNANLNDEFCWWESITLRPSDIAKCAYLDGASIRFEKDRWIIDRWQSTDRARWGIG